MSAQPESIVVENITYYRDAEVVVLTQQGNPPLVFRNEPASGQFQALRKKLEAGDPIDEPTQIGDAACTLAPSLTVDVIGGPIFWEEIKQRLNLKD